MLFVLHHSHVLVLVISLDFIFHLKTIIFLESSKNGQEIDYQKTYSPRSVSAVLGVLAM